MRPPASLLLALLATACGGDAVTASTSPPAADALPAEARAYLAYLDGDLQTPLLHDAGILKTGRRWKPCGAPPWQVPPRALWPSMLPTLRAAQALHAAGLLDGAVIASAYRDPTFNRCEGGAPRSRHVGNNAIDLDLAGPDRRRDLCAFWRRHGPRLRLGLGF